MTTSPTPDITFLLSAARAGDRAALDRVFADVYDEVRRIAHGQMFRAGPQQTLQTTAIVHEAYIKLAAGAEVGWRDRGHFFAVAATAMRQILVDRARRHAAQKRGGGQRALDVDALEIGIDSQAAELLELDQALDRLRAMDERLARVVELRFFAGLSVEETAEVLGVTDRTVKRDWRAARAFLYGELFGDDAPGE